MAPYPFDENNLPLVVDGCHHTEFISIDIEDDPIRTNDTCRSIVTLHICRIMPLGSRDLMEPRFQGTFQRTIAFMARVMFGESN